MSLFDVVLCLGVAAIGATGTVVFLLWQLGMVEIEFIRRRR